VQKEFAVRVPVMIGAVLALAALGGCGGGGTAPTPTAAAQTINCNASGSGTAVAISNFAFNPASANVAVNGFVTWTNSDSTTHTVTFDSGPDCGSVTAGGGTQTAQFTAAGTYAFHCKIHPSMKGTIVVQ
jgi:Plastocyanin